MQKSKAKRVKVISLARQVGSIVLAAQVLCALVLSGATLYHERRTRLRAFDVQLQGHSDSLLGAIQDAEDPEDNVFVDPTELRLPTSDVYAVYDQAGRLIGRSQKGSSDLLQKGTTGIRSLRVNGISYRVLQRPALRIIDRDETGGIGIRRPVTILYASPDGHIWHEVLEAASYSLIAIAFAAACTVAIVVFFSRKALHPLRDLATEAGKVTAFNLKFNTPLSVQQTKELQPLGQVLTSAVESVRRSFEKEQRFFGDAAHELKTSIAVVRSSLQVLMLRDRTTDEYRFGLERALVDNERVETLVAQMLRLASMEEPNRSVVPYLDFSQIANDVCRFLEPIAEARTVQLHTRLQSGTLVRLLPERASALVSNLVINAIQHSAPASAVEVMLKRHGETVQLEVSDHGGGIGEEAIPHVFERFYREDPSRSRETGGTGLGLSICKTIVDAAGGSITVTSKRGVGTVFVVTFTKP